MIPEQVDCIIVGTGLTNSIVAAACSRIGKSVLHIDQNSYYGQEWASFTFSQLVDHIKEAYPESYTPECPEILITKSRLFCLDLCPRLLFSNGPMVKLLVKSNVCKYHEFKNNVQILSLIDDKICLMPSKRNDVFTSPIFTNLGDKRRLMNFVESCVNYELNQEESKPNKIRENEDRPIGELLRSLGLNQMLRDYLINSVALVNEASPTKEACKNIVKFIHATEQYGRSPFLVPLYGCGEFPQSFCRLSAVFGGIYCLNNQIDNLEAREKFEVKFSEKAYKVSSDKLVVDYNSAIALKLINKPVITEKVSRAILITNKSVYPDEQNNISFMRIAVSKTIKSIVHLLELNSSVSVAPPELNVVYLWTRSSSADAKEDLGPIVKQLFASDNESIIWSFYYQQNSGPYIQPSDDENPSTGLQVSSPPRDDVDYESSINEAERIFRVICPDEEFLPRAPDPEEIIS